MLRPLPSATDRGCYAGAACKFQHGEQEQLTPYDKSKSCKFFAAGYCRRGTQCWFKHPGPETSTSVTPQTPATPEPPAVDEEEEEDPDTLCSICFEKPVTFGLLGK